MGNAKCQLYCVKHWIPFNNKKCCSAEAIPGTASLNGEADKVRRYGEQLTCVPTETYGKIGLAAMQTLRMIAKSAARMSKKATASKVLQTLKRKLQRVALHATADVTMLAARGATDDGDPG